MADRAAREGLSRRASFRKTLVEAALPPKYLDSLEQKRKQLDESIHKYIASKEREYKNYERDLRQQAKLAQAREDAVDGGSNATGAEGTTTRRLSPVSSAGRGEDGHQRDTAADTLPTITPTGPDSESNGPDREERREHEDREEREEREMIAADRLTIAGLKDRRASIERDKDFVGVFTPGYLTAIEGKDAQNTERSSSAPEALLSVRSPPKDDADNTPLGRSNSDPAATQAKQKRPLHLQLTSRTSSSGSSADGKLASAMKSPEKGTQAPKPPPKRKRVSLAVGNTIVAPSDSVPLALNHNSSSSHSRVRAPNTEKDSPALTKSSGNSAEPAGTDSPASSADAQGQPEILRMVNGDQEADLQHRILTASEQSPAGSPRTKPHAKVDADGDLFDLMADESDVPLPQAESDEPESAFESEDDVSGRVARLRLSNPGVNGASDAVYDPEGGLVLPEPETPDEEVSRMDFGGSAVASQQPTQPGFRRPSVTRDPTLRGPDYSDVEKGVAEDDIYSSSFSRVGNKGSLTTGSIGESFMERNAEKMMKLRATK